MLEAVMGHWTSAIHHQVHRVLSEHHLEGARLLLAISGGGDSVAMAEVLSDLAKAHRLELRLAHVHHGPGPWQSAREDAVAWVRDYASMKGLPLTVLRGDQVLSSEAELRAFRRKGLEQLLREQGGDRIVTAHHREDLLETRVLRIIRGTGPRGLPAIQQDQSPWFRPFLRTSKKELSEFLLTRGIQHFEDPSNANLEPLRNWLRREWLPALEARQPGALMRLEGSMELLSQQASRTDAEPRGDRIETKVFWGLSLPKQRAWLAQAMVAVGGTPTQGRIAEILRRLDNRQIEHIFRLKELVIDVNAERIWLRKGESTSVPLKRH